MPRRSASLFVVLVLAGSLLAPGSSGAAVDVRFVASYATFDDVPADAELRALGLEVLFRTRAIPAVVLAGPERALARLRASTPVAAIERDRPVPYLLDTASLAVRATDVWGEARWPIPDDVHNEGREALYVDGQIVDGSGVAVAVVDSGVNALHPDLWYADLHHPAMPWEPKTVACLSHFNADTFVDQPYCDEHVGHGTHVAGIVAGTGAAVREGVASGGVGGRPYIGVAPGASIVSAGVGAGATILSALAALDWIYVNAEEYNIRVVNNSWGDAPSCSERFPEEQGSFSSIVGVVQRLVEDKGIVVVFAAGNYLLGEPTWTSTYSRMVTPGVISVANYDDRGSPDPAVNRAGRINSASSDGCAGTTDPLVWTWPDVSAPGENITSANSYTGLTVNAISVLGGGSRRQPFYVQVSGTSMSAPVVAGIAALMLQANPALTPAEVERILIETATPWSDIVSSRGIAGSAAHWGTANATARAFVDPDACRITPAHAAGPEAAAAEFPRFDELPNPDLYVCRDYRRGAGLVDAYAAVERALALRDAP